MSRIVKLSISMLALSIAYQLYQTFSDEATIDRIEKWADKNKLQLNASNVNVRPFSVDYNENEWIGLKKKLAHSRFFEALNDMAGVKRFEYGFDPDYAKNLVDYWMHKFDWKKQIDNVLNRHEQFIFEINGTTIHFVRILIKPNDFDGDLVRLMLIDGWPGAHFSFYKMVEYLNETQNAAYDIIIPSIPGYGYSTPLDKPLDTTDTAMLFDALMRHLHCDQAHYFIHGEVFKSFF